MEEGQASSSHMDKIPCVIVHGGSCTPPDFRENCLEGVQEAAKKGYDVLEEGGSALEAVEKAVCVMEKNPYFNAARGAALNEKEEIECDAMIMDGASMNTGAVMAVSHFAHPVSLAKKVMEKTQHCALNTEGSLAFAREIGFPILDNPNYLITEQSRERGGDCTFAQHVLALEGIAEAHDTVGAVAMDKKGNFACATSTGGIPGKKKGRIGDAALVGCGGYANEYGGATSAGHGEAIMKMTLAREVVYNLERGDDAQTSAIKAICKMEGRIPLGHGGVIVIDQKGNFGQAFNTRSMVWARIKGNKLEYGMDPKECRNDNI